MYDKDRCRGGRTSDAQLRCCLSSEAIYVYLTLICSYIFSNLFAYYSLETIYFLICQRRHKRVHLKVITVFKVFVTSL